MRRRASRRWAVGCGLLSLCSAAAPVWKAPARVRLGELQLLELREEDPAQPNLPRPAVEETLGPFRLRSMEPLPDGRGWRFQVQALAPGLAQIPALDLGNGQRSPELRLLVPRTVPFADAWMGVGGGSDDRLPPLPFPLGWAALLLLPPVCLLGLLVRRWRRGAARRRLAQTQRVFRHHWPPPDRQRGTLDSAHLTGRELLAARFGEAARAWGPDDFRSRRLEPWDQWALSLDAARFGRTDPPFPAPEGLLSALERQGEA